jgi:ABC-type sugar transport system ATPase subunit
LTLPRVISPEVSKKAVSVARMLVRKSEIVAFDEPSASLGLEQKKATLELIKQMAAEGCAT